MLGKIVGHIKTHFVTGAVVAVLLVALLHVVEAFFGLDTQFNGTKGLHIEAALRILVVPVIIGGVFNLIVKPVVLKVVSLVRK